MQRYPWIPLLFVCAFFLAVGSSGITAENTESLRVKIKPFDLFQVRLLASPFKEAQDKNARYLLSVNPDALVAQFRSNAGLEQKGRNYGGWERRANACFSLGHYLSATSMMYAATGDERFKERIDYIVEQLDECQKAGGDGLISPIPNDRHAFAEIKRGDIRSQGFDVNGFWVPHIFDLNGLWVPWYILHKQCAGLIDTYRFTGSAKALEVVKKLADWAIDTTEDLSDEQFARMMICEFGGMNDSLYQLYRITGEKKYFQLAERFYDTEILDPFARERDALQGRHGNTQFPKVVGIAQSYELTGNEKHRRITEFFWDCVVNNHTYVTGGNTMGEHFGPPGKLNDRIDGQTTETCNTYNMLKITRHLYTWTGNTKYLDYYERGLFNHILASVDRSDDTNKLFTYFVPLRSGGYRTYTTPFNTWTCCHGTGMENHAKYGDTIYFHGREGNKDVLYINLLIPSILDWKEKGLKVTISSDNEISIEAEKPIALVVRLRIPRNSTATPVSSKTLNGVLSAPHLVYDRTWEGTTLLNDYIIVGSFQTESMPDNKNRIAFFEGPYLLAGDLGAISKPVVSPFESISEETIPLPSIVGTFNLPGVLSDKRQLKTQPKPTELVPFFNATERYTVYFDLFTEKEWREREMKYQVERTQLQAIERLTVDFFQPGNRRQERDRNFRGINTVFGTEAFGRGWRHATDGGSMTFDMKVASEKTNKLILTYWGNDGGNRHFDILVDGKKIAEQRLSGDAPGRFFDVEHILDDEAFRGKEKVTVTLQARPGATAGGFFGCRTMIIDENE